VITISMPSDQDLLFIRAGVFLLGPVGANGTTSGDSISYTHASDVLSQGQQLFHEKDVQHLKYEGTVAYIPKYSDIKAAPTTKQPYRVTSTTKNMRTGALNTNVASARGHVRAPRYEFDNYTDTVSVRHTWISSASPSRLEWYQAYVTKASPSGYVNFSRNIYEFDSFTGKTCRWSTSSNSAILDAARNRDWLLPRADLPYWCEIAFSKVQPTFTSQSTDLHKVATPPTGLSPSAIKMSVDSLIVANLDKKNFSLKSKHFGDLASQAAAGVNRNNVNMIAFMRDLKDPKALIPKLRNLRNVKTHASNYLAVNYGVLPTISDINEIVAAFKRVSPYIDKNGFSTYNAVHRDSRSFGNITETLEQRIKIAIENEDCDFTDLMNKIHSAGFAPTLENMWDLVPYSFVLDWFIDIGSFLERVDSSLSLLRLNIRYATKSRKRTLTMSFSPTENASIQGTINVVSYHRWTTDQCPLPPLSLSSEITASDHWLEGGALILQRTKTK